MKGLVGSTDLEATLRAIAFQESVILGEAEESGTPAGKSFTGSHSTFLSEDLTSVGKLRTT